MGKQNPANEASIYFSRFSLSFRQGFLSLFQKRKKRLWELDFLRGVAMAMMFVFHFAWDLNYFGFIHESLYSGFWGLFQKATAGLFLLLVGVSLTLSFNRKTEGFAPRFLKRGAQIFSAGLLITAVTWVLFPANFIYFGILHLIGTSIILSIPFVRKKWLNLGLGVAVISIPAFVSIASFNVLPLFWAGFAVPQASFDFAPIFPWFGAVLIGIFAGNFFYERGERKFFVPEMGNAWAGFLQFLGRNSLLLYLLHQPVLFGAVYAAGLFI